MNGILEAAQKSTVFEAAVAYADLRISVIPTRGKEPALAGWKERQTRRATYSTIQFWNASGILENVGIVCGAASDNLVVIDLDGLDAIAAYTSAWPALMDTYTVRSGSGKGAHLYYYVETLPPTTRVVGAACGNIELRANGCYVVAPPSIHPVTHAPYTVSCPLPVMRLPHMMQLVQWVKKLIADKHGGTMPPPTPRPVQQISKYGQMALIGETASVRHATEGGRNDALNRAAFKLGQLVAAGALSRATVENDLYAAAWQLVNEDGEDAVKRTIQSGLNAGIAKPREVKS